MATKLADDFFAGPPSDSHPNFLVAELSGVPRLLVDQPDQINVSLMVNVAAIVDAVERRIAATPNTVRSADGA